MTRPAPVPARRAIHVFLVFLALASLPLVGPAAGQASVSTTMPEGDGALLDDAENTVLVLEDPAEDAEPLFVPTSTPGTPLDQMADITSLTISETQDAFRFDLAHRGYDGALFTASRAAEGFFSCTIRFAVNGIEDLDHATYLYAYLGEDGAPTYSAYAQRIDTRGDRYDYDYLGAVQAGFVDDHFELSLEKSWISVAPRDRVLQPDDRLTDVRVSCMYSTAVFIGGAYSDYAASDDPGAGTGSYTVSMAPGSSLLALTFLGNDGPVDAQTTLPASTGGPTKQTLELVSQADRKLLVNMTARITDGAGTELDGWKAVVPPTLEVKADTPARATLVISAPPDASHGARGVLELVASPLGHDDPARVTRPVAAAVPLTPENSTLWFHNGWRGGCANADCFTPDDAPKTWDYEPEWFVLAPVEDHPIYDRAYEPSGLVRDRYWMDAGTVLDLPLVKPLRFDPEGTIDITLGLSAEVEREIDVDIDLVVDWGEAFIGGLEETITIGPEATAHTFSVTPREEMLDLPAGTEFQMLMKVSEVPLDMQFGGPVQFHTAMSRMDLALLPLAEGTIDITDGRALPTIQPVNGTELEEYSNPGKRQVYELALVNEGSEEDVLKVDAETDLDGWGVQILPGNRFQLEAGQTAPFSLVVTAPDDAAEGETMTVTLTATSANDADVKTTIDIRTRITHGVEIEDEEYVEPSAADRIDPYTGDVGEASEIATLLIFPAGLGLLGPFLRRRR